jgi:CHAT domain-containing protein
VKGVGAPCEGKPHARCEVAAGGNQRQSATPRGAGASRRPYPDLRHEYLASAHAAASAPFGASAAAATRRLQEAVTKIRGQAGFETFATGATDADIRNAVEPGWPLVYVNPTPFGTMLVLIEKGSDDAMSEHQDLLASPTSTAIFTRIGMGGDHEWPDETIEPSRAFMFVAASDHQLSVDLRCALDHTLPWVGQEIAKPVARLLTASKATGVTLILSGPLAAVPLHASPLDETGRCLLDDFDVRYAPSAVSLAASLSRGHGNGANLVQLVALADPEREVQSRALPAAEPEVREIARSFPAALTRIAVGRDANSSFFREHAGQAEYLHLACHAGGGMFDLNNGGIALADRIVRPLELTEMAFLRARLAVASACQTAQAEILGQPDEVFSIGAILLASGSACAVATQWSVNDAAAAILMTRFYEVMFAEHLRPPEALRVAQLWLRDLTPEAEAEYLSRHQALAANIFERRARGEAIGQPIDDPADRRYASPIFWAPFVALGA